MKIVFVCHGNICRSPMAEYIMKDSASKAGLLDVLEISSAAVSYEEEGNDIYPPARRVLAEHNIPFSRHSAHRICLQEFQKADLVLVMDRSNLSLLTRIVGDYTNLLPSEITQKLGFKSKVYRLMELCGESKDVADPWYTGDFNTTYNDIKRACESLCKVIKESDLV